MTILCATDFSPSSEAALDLAATVAQRQGGPVCLLHVMEPMAASVPAALPEAILAAAPWQTDAEQAAADRLQGDAARLRARGLTVTTEVLLGSAATTIQDTARQKHARLIVIGTHGRKGAARLFLGSVAEAVVRSAPCPVLVARGSQVDLARWTSDQPLRLAVGFDGSPASEAALDFVEQIAASWSPEISVVRPYWPGEEAYRYGIEATLPEGDEHNPELVRLLERDTGKLLESHPALRNSQLRFRPAHVNAAEVLVSEAAGIGADVIVVGTGDGRLPAWNALQPVAVLRAGQVPVLCVPGKPAAEQQVPAIRSVLIATDLSDASRQAVLTGYALLPMGGRVELCHVHERERVGGAFAEVPLSAALSATRGSELEARVRALVPPEASARRIVTNVHLIEGLTAAESLLQAARRLDVDMLVLGGHGRTGAGRVLLGSVAEEVARHSSRPVVIALARKHERA
jgi:nucleotide-binding universal stress UspA family protein